MRLTFFVYTLSLFLADCSLFRPNPLDQGRGTLVLVVSPSRQVLPVLLAEVQAQGVPFATIGDLKDYNP